MHTRKGKHRFFKKIFKGSIKESKNIGNSTSNSNGSLDGKDDKQNKTKKIVSVQSQVTVFNNDKTGHKTTSINVNESMDKLNDNVGKGNKFSKLRESKMASINKTLKTENIDDFNMDPEVIKNTIKQLIKYQWYHGLLPRDEVEEFLVSEGDYLVRKSEVNSSTRFVLSVKGKDMHINHVVLNWSDGSWYMLKGEVSCPQLDELLKTYITNETPIGNNKVILRRPIPKPHYYIDHDHIKILKEIGHGAFGVVCVGTYTINDVVKKCAIKSLKIGKKIDKIQRKEFVKEAKINLKLKHKNIVNLYGFAINEEPLMIVLEYCENGALNSYLKKHPETSNNVCTKFVVDACRGMCYLASKNIIHRDLAARNCLIDENLTVKISDFGLSVANVVSITLNAKTKVPIKWLSPETIKEKHFNLATDVWSFGVVIWEIFSRCQSEPYPRQSNKEAKEIIISGRKPMNAPPNTPPVFANAMDKCFTQNPKLRPTFGVLLKFLAPSETPPDELVFCTY
uniref:Tyrosine-protein kinase n=1 Tax=Strongyloides venezuelensis TaxID=75913 RepID=A0A0K0FLF6_STRVS